MYASPETEVALGMALAVAQTNGSKLPCCSGMKLEQLNSRPENYSGLSKSESLCLLGVILTSLMTMASNA